MSLLIALTGAAGSGKDTFADILVEHHGFIKRAFADPLYEEIAAAYGVTVDFLCNRETKETPLFELSFDRCKDADFLLACARADVKGMGEARSPRRILQLWGTEYRRAQRQNYWTDQMAGYVQRHWQQTNIVIPDCRFFNEAVWVNQHGGKIVKIIRPGVAAVAAHVSEAGFSERMISRTVLNGTDFTWRYHLERAASVVVEEFEASPA